MDNLSVFESAIQSFLGPILPYLHDDSVSEILINGPHEVFIERKGRLEKTAARFADEDALQAAVHNIAQSVGRRITVEEPTLDARLPDGSRIHVVFPPCSRNGTVVSIRKFMKQKISFPDYIKFGSITLEAAQFLDVCMFLGKNILVSGGTGSGKTTLLSLLSSRIPKNQRVILIEDASELTLDYDHVVRFETKMPDEQGKGEVRMRDLLKSSLRLRPDRIIVGEVRGGEALELINAMNTGHQGCLGTIHANTPFDSLVRLETLAMSAEGRISEQAVRQQVISALQLVVQIARFPDGSRKITHISEVGQLDSSKNYTVTDLFKCAPVQRDSHGKVSAPLITTGAVPTFIDEIEGNKIPFGREKFKVA